MPEIFTIAVSFVVGVCVCAGVYLRWLRPRPAEQELRRERDFSESILNSLPGMFYLLDQEGRELRWNRRKEELTGYSAREIAQMNAFDFVADDQKPLVASRIQDVFDRGEATVELDIVCKDGTRIPHFCTGKRIEVDGQPCLIGVGLDITDRQEVERKLRESELQYRTLFDYAPDAIVVFDVDMQRFIDANDNALRLFKMDRQQLFEVGPVEMSPPTQPDGRSTPEYAAGVIEKAIDGVETVFDWVHRDSEGKDFDCEVRLVRLPSVDRRLVRGSVIDVSERKRAERRLHQQEEMLAHVSRLSTMGELVAGIAHEVNQPLYSIQNFAKASSNVLNGDAPPNLTLLREWNREMAGAARRAGEIIKRLRGFVSRHEPEKQDADINEIVHEAVDLIAFEARRSGTQIDFQLDPELAPIAVDRVQMQQVLVNLLKNSIEAMSADGDMRIVTVRTVAEDSVVEVVVSDTGPGLKSDEKMNVFAPFVTTKPNGMGMGLAISRSIAEAHGGRLWCAPNAAGAEFHLTLPVEQSANVVHQPHGVCR